MGAQIKLTFDQYCKNMRVDSKLIKSLKALDVGFVTKNSEHIAFFGSGLLGVHEVKWLDENTYAIYDDILQVDDLELKEALYALTTVRNGKTEPLIDKTQKVRSDVLNMAFAYLITTIYNSKLTAKEKREGIISVVRLMHYKFLTSLLFRYFEHGTDEGIAKATYAALSMKFDIKRLGSWSALILERAEDYADGKTVHMPSVKHMTDDGLFYILSDVQTRIRNVVKAQTKVFYAVRDGNSRVLSTSRMFEMEDGLVIKDVTRAYTQYSRNIYDTLSDRHEYVKQELIKLCGDLVPSCSPEQLNHALVWMSSESTDTRKKWILELVEATVLYAFDFIRRNHISTTDLAAVVTKLKAMYIGSRVNDSSIIKQRKLGDRLIKESLGTKNPSSSNRTALLLYIVLRTLTMNHYR